MGKGMELLPRDGEEVGKGFSHRSLQLGPFWYEPQAQDACLLSSFNLFPEFGGADSCPSFHT